MQVLLQWSMTGAQLDKKTCMLRDTYRERIPETCRQVIFRARQSSGSSFRFSIRPLIPCYPLMARYPAKSELELMMSSHKGFRLFVQVIYQVMAGPWATGLGCLRHSKRIAANISEGNW